KAKAFDLFLTFWHGIRRQEQERFARCAAEFISLISVKETEPKKTLCAQSTPGCSLMKGFFERASCPRRKTAHIHVRRPPGLRKFGEAVGSLEAESQSQRQGQGQGQVRGKPACGAPRGGRTVVLQESGTPPAARPAPARERAAPAPAW